MLCWYIKSCISSLQVFLGILTVGSVEKAVNLFVNVTRTVYIMLIIKARRIAGASLSEDVNPHILLKKAFNIFPLSRSKLTFIWAKLSITYGESAMTDTSFSNIKTYAMTEGISKSDVMLVVGLPLASSVGLMSNKVRIEAAVR